MSNPDGTPPFPEDPRDDDEREQAMHAANARDAARYRFWRGHYSSRFVIRLGPKGLEGATFPATRPQVEALGPEYQRHIDEALDAAIARATHPTGDKP